MAGGNRAVSSEAGVHSSSTSQRTDCTSQCTDCCSGIVGAVRISANGFLTFSGDHGDGSHTTAIPHPALPNDLVAVYWTDLDPSAGGMLYTYTGPDNAFWVVQWEQIPIWGYDQARAAGQPTSGQHASFEAILYPSGRIDMKYKHAPRPVAADTFITIGIENTDGMQGEQIAWNDANLPSPSHPTSITIPSSCEADAGARMGAGNGRCSGTQWSVRVFHDMAFQTQVSTACTSFRTDASLQVCGGEEAVAHPEVAHGCWCPSALHRYDATWQNATTMGRSVCIACSTVFSSTVLVILLPDF